MTALVRVAAVEHLGARLLRITFSDGLVRELDFANTLPGVLATIAMTRSSLELKLMRLPARSPGLTASTWTPTSCTATMRQRRSFSCGSCASTGCSRRAERGPFERTHGRSRGRCCLACRSVIPSQLSFLNRTPVVVFDTDRTCLPDRSVGDPLRDDGAFRRGWLQLWPRQ